MPPPRSEVHEELGFSPPVGRLLVADWWNDSPDGIGGAKVLFVFAGGVLAPAHRDGIVVDGTEIVGHAFRSLADLGPLTAPRLTNRLSHTLAAHKAGTTVYLEDGDPTPPET